jgi:hypothetical protein
MPVVFRQSGLRCYFFSNEGHPPEPAHIHVKGGGCDAKIWIEPEVSIAEATASIPATYGISPHRLGNRDPILRAWHDRFSH